MLDMKPAKCCCSCGSLGSLHRTSSPLKAPTTLGHQALRLAVYALLARLVVLPVCADSFFVCTSKMRFTFDFVLLAYNERNTASQFKIDPDEQAVLAAELADLHYSGRQWDTPSCFATYPAARVRARDRRDPIGRRPRGRGRSEPQHGLAVGHRGRGRRACVPRFAGFFV